jgi:hypothetical protein
MPIDFKNNTDFNYAEIVLVKKDVDPNIFDIDFTEEECSSIIQHVLSKYRKNNFFRKHSIKYMFDTLEMSCCTQDNLVTTNNLILVDHCVHKTERSMFLVNMYNKTLLPNHSFPSTTNIKDIVDSKRLSMKITNNIYINVDSLQYDDDTIVRHVYVNVNIKKSNDIGHISEMLEGVLDSIY